jgi:hypothetical protein
MFRIRVHLLVRFARNDVAVPVDPPDGGTAPAVRPGFAPASGVAPVPATRARRPAPAPKPWLAGSFFALAVTGLVAVLLAVLKEESSLAMLVPGGLRYETWWAIHQGALHALGLS